MGFGLKRRWNRHKIAVIEALPLFAPGSAGDTRALHRLTIQAAQRTFPLMVRTLAAAGREPMRPVSSWEFGRGSEAETQELGERLDFHGSDKVSHGYHPVYAKILQDRSATQMLEVGLGTNNEDVPSNMTRHGRPGASLRAFRDFLPGARILGADIDRRALFTEDRIDTVWVDQTDLASFEELRRRAEGFSLLIDDGLHSPDANLAVLIFGLETMAVGAWTVIEDIVPAALPAWQVLAATLPDTLEVTIIQANTSLMFAVRKVA